MTANTFDYSNILDFLPVFEETVSDRLYFGDFVVYSLKNSGVVSIGQLLPRDSQNDIPDTVWLDGVEVGRKEYKYEGDVKVVLSPVVLDRVDRFDFIKPLRYFPNLLNSTNNFTKTFPSVAKRVDNFIGYYVTARPMGYSRVIIKVVSYEFSEETGIVRLGYPSAVDALADNVDALRDNPISYFSFMFDEEVEVSVFNPYYKW